MLLEVPKHTLHLGGLHVHPSSLELAYYLGYYFIEQSTHSAGTGIIYDPVDYVVHALGELGFLSHGYVFWRKPCHLLVGESLCLF